MKATKTYLKGKSIFIVSLIVVSITFLIVFLTGKDFALSEKLYLSLSTISLALFIFMFYGLYTGVGLIDNFPKVKDYKIKAPFSESGTTGPTFDIDGDFLIDGIILSFLAWLVMSVIAVILFFFLEAFVWFSIFILLSILYWVFFRALRLVFSKAKVTKGNMLKSIGYSMGYTILSVGWIFVITFVAELIN